MERQVLPLDVGEDVTIDVGVGIADDGLVSLADLAVAVDVDEAHVAGLEILVCAGGIGQVEVATLTGSKGFLVGGQHTVGLVAVEHTCGLSHDGSDVVDAVDAGNIALCRLLTVNVNLRIVGQRLHLILIMASADAHLHIQVVHDDGLTRHRHLEALIVERTAVAPVISDTGYGIVELLQREQVLGVVHIEVEVDA